MTQSRASRAGEIGYESRLRGTNWYGTCEEPCADIWYDGEQWVVPYALRLPAAPHCVPDCTVARRTEAGECVDPGGAPMPAQCCACTPAALDDAGRCESPDGLALPAFCCPA